MEIEVVKVPVAPVPVARFNPALRRAHAPPPRILNIFTIAAAVAMVLIPIVVYAFTPTLPDLER